MDSAAEASQRRGFPALGHRDFRILWLGMLFASGTMAFQYYAQMWLVYSLTGSALLLGVLGATRGTAMLLFGLYGGALADRLDRRALLMVTQSVSLVMSLTLGLMAINGLVELWLAFTLIFIIAATSSIDGPVRQALIPELVPKEHIPNAVALTTAAQMGTFALSPVLAGSVIDALGPGGAYAVSTFGNVAVIVALILLHYRGQPREARSQSVMHNIRDGLTYARQNRTVLWIVALMFATGAFGMAIFSSGLIVKWAREVLDLTPGEYGRLATIWGIGTLTVSYSLAFMGNIPHKGKIFIFGAILFGLSFILFGFARWLPLAGFAYLVNGAAWTGTNISSTAIVQSTVPNEVRGRVMSLYMLNQAVSQMNGVSLGAIADRVGMEVLLPGTTILCTSLIILLALFVPTLRQLDKRSMAPAPVPAQA